MKRIISSVLLIILFLSSNLWAGIKREDTTVSSGILFRPTNLQRFRLELGLMNLRKGENSTSVSFLRSTTADQQKKSVGKAFLYSAVLPGAGQWYAGSRLKSIIFFGVEAVAWTGYFIYRQKGVNKEEEYKAFADEHWDYLKWIASGDTTGTHHIPVDANGNPIKTYDYYEMIGKYDQFNTGWDDTESKEITSRRRLHYMDLRHITNNYFRLATLGTTIALANHVLSALDATWCASKYNRRIVKTSLRLEKGSFNHEILPKATLTVQW